MRIVVGSYLVQFPVGGYLACFAQWPIGFHRLGHDVWYVEKAFGPQSCFDASSSRMTDDCSYGARVVASFLEKFGPAGKWCFVDHNGVYHGESKEKIEQVFRSADLFVDTGSHGFWSREAEWAGLRVFVDGEPGYRQMSMIKALASGLELPQYNHYFTVGRNVGTPASSAPTAGHQWRYVFNPVLADLFVPSPSIQDSSYTTVMTWQAHSPLQFEGKTYGQKDIEFPKFLSLPRRVKPPVEVAAAGARTPHDALKKNGWRVVDAHRVSCTFESYRRYIAGSRGEFSVCKNVFVATNSGWFSDRSAAYLASGRPAIVQETGFSAHLPCGAGLFAVNDVEEAAAAIEEVESDYERHSQAAREIATEYLDVGRVLAGLLRAVGA